MDDIQHELMGRFPRFVGQPKQWAVFDEGTFDDFLSHNEGEADCYSRISWYGRDGSIMLDEVFLDLDGEKPSGFGVSSDTDMVQMLRSDKGYRNDVLGRVVDDVREIAELCHEESIPVVGVYTGKGVHIHALFEERASPQDAFSSRQRWFVEECDVDTFDEQVNGDIKRLCRVPNCRRYDEKLGQPTDMYTVPLSKDEMRQITVDELVRFGRSQRQISVPGESRPPFLQAPDYESEISYQVEEVEAQETGQMTEVTEKLEAWLKDVLQLPCMYERLQTRNPSHYVRLNSAVLMFNVGMSVSEVLTVFSQLGWHDFDRKVTRKHLKQIKRRGYVSMSCSKIQSKGLCVFSKGERAEECPHYGYNGGDKEY